MSAMKYFVPVVAIAGAAVAQSSCSNSATTTITAAADASAFSSCKTFSGSIAVATGLGDAIAIDGLTAITGDLVVSNNSQIPSLSGDSLTTIGGAFKLDTLTIMSTLSFPELTKVGSIEWNALQGLTGLSFSAGISQTSELNIQNTQLQSLDGINLEEVDTVFIANNNYLNDIQMQLGNITNSLIIQTNGDNVSAIFPNLIWANNMTFGNVSQIELNSLVHVNGSLGFYSNFVTSLKAANLTTVGTSKSKQGDLTIVSNSDITNVSFPQLTKIWGGLSIQNNTELTAIDGFGSLESVTGAINLRGNFSDVAFPALNDAEGAFTLQSSGSVDCSPFKSLKGSKKIQGSYTCKASVSNPNDPNASSTSSGSSSSSSSSAGAASGNFVPSAAAGLMGVVAAIFGLM